MKGKRFARYVEVFMLAALIIIFYKMFDNIKAILESFGNLMGILKSFIYGGSMAFFLYPIVMKLEELFERKQWKLLLKKKRFYAVLITFVGLLLVVIVSFRFLIPLAIDNTIEFIGKLNSSKMQLVSYVEEYITDPIWNERLIDYISKLDLMTLIDSYDLNTVTNQAISSISEAFNVLVGIVLIPYILYEKDNLLEIFNNILSLFLKDKIIKVIDDYMRASSIIFYNFIYGKLIDSLIIGIIALVFFLVFGYRFAIVYALIIGFTNIIPYFGPFIGGIPVTMISFIADGFTPCLICGIFIFALQQFDGLILGPHILGGQVGVRPLWIIFSITLFGGLFGFIGMFVGVPLIAILGMMLNDLVRTNKKRKRELLEQESTE